MTFGPIYPRKLRHIMPSLGNFFSSNRLARVRVAYRDLETFFRRRPDKWQAVKAAIEEHFVEHDLGQRGAQEAVIRSTEYVLIPSLPDKHSRSTASIHASFTCACDDLRPLIISKQHRAPRWRETLDCGFPRLPQQTHHYPSRQGEERGIIHSGY